MKLADARKDHYRRLAHEQGFRARSAFKLKELNKSYRIIGPGFYVLDLGCAPGGWTQVAVKLVGNQGKVMGVDLSYVEEIPGAHIVRDNIENEHLVDDVLSYFGQSNDIDEAEAERAKELAERELEDQKSELDYSLAAAQLAEAAARLKALQKLRKK